MPAVHEIIQETTFTPPNSLVIQFKEESKLTWHQQLYLAGNIFSDLKEAADSQTPPSKQDQSLTHIQPARLTKTVRVIFNFIKKYDLYIKPTNISLTARHDHLDPNSPIDQQVINTIRTASTEVAPWPETT